MKIVQLTIACMIVVAFSSCLKEDQPKKLVCRIGTITEITAREKYITQFTYGSDNKIASVDVLEGTYQSTHKAYNYSGNTILINVTRTTGATTFVSRDSITIDDKGKVLNIRINRPNSPRFTNYQMVYNGDVLDKTEVTTERSGTAEVSSSTYANGNLVSVVAPVVHSSFEYYTEKELQQGDYLETSNVVTYGISIGPSKNLVKSSNIGGNITNYQYEFNSQGLITKLTLLDSRSAVIATRTYHYICD